MNRNVPPGLAAAEQALHEAYEQALQAGDVDFPTDLMIRVAILSKNCPAALMNFVLKHSQDANCMLVPFKPIRDLLTETGYFSADEICAAATDLEQRHFLQGHQIGHERYVGIDWDSIRNGATT